MLKSSRADHHCRDILERKIKRGPSIFIISFLPNEIQHFILIKPCHALVRFGCRGFIHSYWFEQVCAIHIVRMDGYLLNGPFPPLPPTSTFDAADSMISPLPPTSTSIQSMIIIVSPPSISPAFSASIIPSTFPVSLRANHTFWFEVPTYRTIPYSTIRSSTLRLHHHLLHHEF